MCGRRSAGAAAAGAQLPVPGHALQGGPPGQLEQGAGARPQAGLGHRPPRSGGLHGFGTACLPEWPSRHISGLQA